MKHMKFWCLIGVIAVLLGRSVGQGQIGGTQPAWDGKSDIQMKMPWGAWEFGFKTGWDGAPQAKRVAEPFKMFDNMYFVGLEDNSVLVITTSDGLILIDTAVPATSDGILNNIRKVGLDPANIKYILISHEHNDHFGGA